MDLWQALGVIIRRWYVFLPIALGAIALAWQAGGTVDPEYTARASAILIVGSSPSDAAVETTNPWGDLPTTAKAIKLTVENSEYRNQVADEGLVRDYAIGVENREPILEVATSSGDAGVAQDTTDLVLELMASDLQAKQDQVAEPEPTRVSLQVLSRPDLPTVTDGGKSRVRVVIVALGLLVATAAAFLVDGWATRRRARTDTGAPSRRGTDDRARNGRGNGDGYARPGRRVEAHSRPTSTTATPTS